MGDNKRKKYFTLDTFSSNDIYALLDAVDSDNEQDNLMNDSDTEFIASDDVELVDQDDDMRSTTTTPAS